MTKIPEVAGAIVELPPAPPTYVVTYEVISADCCEHLDCAVRPPGEPPHDGHEDPEEGPREPRRINLSENLNLSETLTAVLINKGSDVAR
jgi:hypothetical protein